MFGWFCNKKEEKKSKFVTKSEKVNVGKAIIRFTLEDGQVIDQTLQGYAYSVNIGQFSTKTAKEMAHYELNFPYDGSVITIPDDITDTKRSIVGVITQKEVISFSDYEVDVNVTYMEECKCD